MVRAVEQAVEGARPRRHHRLRPGQARPHRQVRRHRQLQRRPAGRRASARGAGKADGKPAPRLDPVPLSVGSESTEQREKGFLDYVNEEIARQKKAEPADPPRWLSTDKYAGATVGHRAAEKAAPLLHTLPGPGSTASSRSTSRRDHRHAQRPAQPGAEQEGPPVGFDSSEPLAPGGREGDVDGLIVQDPYRMGYLGVWTLVQHLEGYDVAADGKNLSTGEYVVTKENVDTEEIRGLFDPARSRRADDRAARIARKKR